MAGSVGNEVVKRSRRGRLVRQGEITAPASFRRSGGRNRRPRWLAQRGYLRKRQSQYTVAPIFRHETLLPSLPVVYCVLPIWRVV